jgi:hypothetical protein
MSEFEWLKPWFPVGDQEDRDFWEQQLAGELHETHVLSGEAVMLIALGGNDDALFQLSDGRVAEVHLTFSRGRQSSPLWPGTAIYAHLPNGPRKA